LAGGLFKCFFVLDIEFIEVDIEIDVVANIEFISIAKSIMTDLDTPPYKIELLQNYFMTKQKNFNSSYYNHRWSLDPNFMIHFYKLLFHAENFDLEAVY
jgi:hypothetical protein